MGNVCDYKKSIIVQDTKEDKQRDIFNINSNDVKVIILGMMNVGKTSILIRLIEDTFGVNSTYNTIGVDYQTHEINHNGKNYNLNIWDTGGDEAYRTLIKNSF